jgi:hypothetical protein
MIVLLVVDVSPVSDGDNHDRFLVLVKDDTPISDSQAQAIATLEPLHVAVPVRCKLRQPLVNPATYVT